MPKLFDDSPRFFRTGEALVAEEGFDKEVSHIDLLIGDKRGPVGTAFCGMLPTQSEGHSNLLAVIAPNTAAKPDTLTFTKVTIGGAKQAVQMFGPAQTAVGNAMNDAFLNGEFDDIITDPRENLCAIVGVFIHWEANDDGAILRANYKATRLAIRRATTGGPLADELEKAQKESLWHLFAGIPNAPKDGYMGPLFAETMSGLRAAFDKPKSA
jgi:5,6,7,8-tetrahydromethanopterin hydro-lyase